MKRAGPTVSCASTDSTWSAGPSSHASTRAPGSSLSLDPRALSSHTRGLSPQTPPDRASVVVTDAAKTFVPCVQHVDASAALRPSPALRVGGVEVAQPAAGVAPVRGSTFRAIPLKPATRRCIVDEASRSGFYTSLSRQLKGSAIGVVDGGELSDTDGDRAAGAALPPRSPRAMRSAHALAECPLKRTAAHAAPGHSLSRRDAPTPPTVSLPPSTSVRKIRLPCAGDSGDDDDGCGYGGTPRDEDDEDEIFATSESAHDITVAPARLHIAPLTRTYISPELSPASSPDAPRATAPSGKPVGRKSRSGSRTGAVVVLDSGAVLKQTLASMEKALWTWVETACVRLGELPTSGRGLARLEQYRGPLPASLRCPCCERTAASSAKAAASHPPAGLSGLLCGGALRQSGTGECVVMKRVATFLPVPRVSADDTHRNRSADTSPHALKKRQAKVERACVDALLRPSLAVYLWHTRHLHHPGLASVIDAHTLHGALHEEKRSARTESADTDGVNDDVDDSENDLDNGGEVLRYRVSHRIMKDYAAKGCHIDLEDIRRKEWCAVSPRATSRATTDETAPCTARPVRFPGAHHAQSVFLVAREYVPSPAVPVQAYLRTWRTWALPPVSSPGSESTLTDDGSDHDMSVPSLFPPQLWVSTTRFHQHTARLLQQIVEPLVFLHRHTFPAKTRRKSAGSPSAAVERNTELAEDGTPVHRFMHGNVKPSNVLIRFSPFDGGVGCGATPRAPAPPTAAALGVPSPRPQQSLEEWCRVCLTDYGLPMFAPDQCDAQMPPLRLHRKAIIAGAVVSAPCVYRCLLPVTARQFFTYGSHAPSPTHPHARLDVRDPDVQALLDSVPFVAPECLLLTCDEPHGWPSSPADVVADAGQRHHTRPQQSGLSSPRHSPMSATAPASTRLWVLDTHWWSPAADAFSVGALWFALLTGEAPPAAPYPTLALTTTVPSNASTLSSPRAGCAEGGKAVATPYTDTAKDCLDADHGQVEWCSEVARNRYRRGLLEVLVAHIFGCEFVTAGLLEIARDVGQLGFTGSLARVAVSLLVQRLAGTAEAAQLVALVSVGGGIQRRPQTDAPAGVVALPECLFPYRTARSRPQTHNGILDDCVTLSGPDTSVLLGQALFAMLCMTERCGLSFSIYEAMLGLLDPDPQRRWTLPQFQRSAFFQVFGASQTAGNGGLRAAVPPTTALASATPAVYFSSDPCFRTMTAGPAFRWLAHGAGASPYRSPAVGSRRSSWESVTPSAAATPVGGATAGPRQAPSSPRPCVAAPHAAGARLFVACLVVTFATKLRRRAQFTLLKRACAARRDGPSGHVTAVGERRRPSTSTSRTRSLSLPVKPTPAPSARAEVPRSAAVGHAAAGRAAATQTALTRPRTQVLGFAVGPTTVVHPQVRRAHPHSPLTASASRLPSGSSATSSSSTVVRLTGSSTSSASSRSLGSTATRRGQLSRRPLTTLYGRADTSTRPSVRTAVTTRMLGSTTAGEPLGDVPSASPSARLRRAPLLAQPSQGLRTGAGAFPLPLSRQAGLPFADRGASVTTTFSRATVSGAATNPLSVKPPLRRP